MTEFPRYDYDSFGEESNQKIKDFIKENLNKILPGTLSPDELIDVFIIITDKTNAYSEETIEKEL